MAKYIPGFHYYDVSVITFAHDFGIILPVYPLGKFLVVELLSQWEQTFKMLTDIAKLFSREMNLFILLGTVYEGVYFPIILWALGITKLLFVCPFDRWKMKFRFVMHFFNYEWGWWFFTCLLALFLIDCSYPLPVWWLVYEFGYLNYLLSSFPGNLIYW